MIGDSALEVVGIGRHAAMDVVCVRFNRALSDAEINWVRQVLEREAIPNPDTALDAAQGHCVSRV